MNVTQLKFVKRNGSVKNSKILYLFKNILHDKTVSTNYILTS